MMAKEYVPIYLDWTENTQDLTAEEKGNLIDAVILYASGQEYEHLLTGGTKIAFRFMKGQIDRNSAISDARAKAGSNKKEQTGANANKTEQTGTNDNKPEQTGTKSPKEKEEEKEENKKKDKNLSLPHPAADGFDRFWAAYPRKTSKQDAKRAFDKLKPTEEQLQVMLSAIERQKQSQQWQDADGRYIPHPATWLNGKRWEDELPTAKGSVGGKVTPIRQVVAQNYSQRDYSEPYSSPEDMLAALNEELGIQGTGVGV